MTGEDGIVRELIAASGKTYELGRLVPGELQYVDRDYRFNFIPEGLCGCLHVRTHGNDKLIDETAVCLSFELLSPADVVVLYADKFPVLPAWLHDYERLRSNVTRLDTRADNLKGYFGLYRQSFGTGPVVLHGCSPCSMLAHDWYVDSGGANYCMYTVAVVPRRRGATKS